MSYRSITAKDWLKAGLYILLTITLISVSAALLSQFEMTGIIVWLVIAAGSMYLLVRWHANSTAYRCAMCNHEFEIPVFTDLISPHFFSKKYLKCPQCDKRSWTTILMRSDV